MDHDELVRRFHTDPNTLDPETRARNEHLREMKEEKRRRGEIAYEFDELHKNDIPDFRPVPPEEQASTGEDEQ